MHAENQSLKVRILVPVFNDWTAVAELIQRLGSVLNGREEDFRLLLINDGSTEPDYSAWRTATPFPGHELRLRRNLGHQRAIAIGLAWLFDEDPVDAVVVMDGDGEDRPEDVPRLLDRFAQGGGRLSVFAERTRRSEGMAFASLYAAYRLLHRMATGIPVRIGNFSILSRAHLDGLMVSSDLWNHYAAAVVHLGVPIVTIPTTRGKRYSGSSRMNFASLVRHGLSALAVFADVIAVRSLVATGILCGVSFALLVFFAFTRVFTNWQLPQWTIYASAFFLIVLLQLLSLTFSATLHAFAGSTSARFLPVRDYSHFVQQAIEIERPPARGLGGAR